MSAGAMVCVQLERYEEAVEWCDQGLRVGEGGEGGVIRG